MKTFIKKVKFTYRHSIRSSRYTIKDVVKSWKMAKEVFHE